MCLKQGQGPERAACCVQAECGTCVQSAVRLGSTHFMLDTTTWKHDLRMKLNEIYDSKICLKESGFGWLVPFSVRYMTLFGEGKKNFNHDCKRNSPRLLWRLVIVLLVLDAKFPNSINKRLLFHCIMWALLSGKDPESELLPSVSCLILQWHCQLEITVLTFQASFYLLATSFQLLSFRKTYST